MSSMCNTGSRGGIQNSFSAGDMDAGDDHWIRLLDCTMPLRESGDDAVLIGQGDAFK